MKGMDKVIRVSGFGWDPFKKVVTADDQCWASYIKENPDAKKFRTTTCPSYNELTIIFGDTCGTGWAQIAPSQDVDALDEDLSTSKEGLHDSASNTLGEEPSFGDGVQDNISETQGEDNHRKRRIDTLSGSRRGKRESRGSELSQVLESLVEVQKERNASRAQLSSATTSNPFSISNCIRELHQMEGVDQESDAVFKAMEKFQSPGWRDFFNDVTSATFTMVEDFIVRIGLFGTWFIVMLALDYAYIFG